MIRLAVPADRDAIAAFCHATWGHGGEDYIERVIDDWMARADGALAVADVSGRAVACSYVRLLSPHEAFLAGMRVDPAYRHAGLSIALTEHCVRYAASRGRTTARVIIGWNNAAALGAIARSGFSRAGSMMLWEREAHDGPSVPDDLLARPGEAAPPPPPGALWAIGWMARELTGDDMKERIASGWALRHDGGRALLRPGDEYLWLAWLSGPAASREVLARAAVAAAANARFPKCRALLANDAATDHALEVAGFARRLEYHVYERRTG